MSVPAPVYRLEEISPRAFQHPADRAATAALQQIPYLDAVVRRLIQLGYERALRQSHLGAAVRLGESQLPDIWGLHREAFQVLDIEDIPDLYLTQWPIADAATIGAGQPIVVLNSELVRLLDPGSGPSRGRYLRRLLPSAPTCSALAAFHPRANAVS